MQKKIMVWKKNLGIKAAIDFFYFSLIFSVAVFIFYSSFFPLPRISFALYGYIIDVTLLSYFISFFSLSVSLGWTASLTVGLASSFVYRNQKTEKCIINPLVSVLIPARNEENVIGDILRNLQDQTYSNLEIIPICHNCTDKTYDIAMSFAAEDRRIKPLEIIDDKFGKAYGLNYGLEFAHGELVTVFDCDSKFDKDFMEKSVSYFQRDDVDAIQPRIVSSNHNSYLLSFLADLEFSTYSDLLQLSRKTLRANGLLGGTGCTVRKQALEKIGGWETCLVEDFALSLKLNTNGYKIKYAYPVKVYDERVPFWSSFVRQRSRWMRGNWELVKKYLLKSITKPSDFFLLTSSLWIFIMYYTFFVLLLNLLGGWVLSFYTPFYVWFGLWVIQLSCLFIRSVNVRRLKGLVYFPLFILYMHHWVPVFVYAVKLKDGWKSTKTKHGFR